MPRPTRVDEDGRRYILNGKGGRLYKGERFTPDALEAIKASDIKLLNNCLEQLKSESRDVTAEALYDLGVRAIFS